MTEKEEMSSVGAGILNNYGNHLEKVPESMKSTLTALQDRDDSKLSNLVSPPQDHGDRTKQTSVARDEALALALSNPALLAQIGNRAGG